MPLQNHVMDVESQNPQDAGGLPELVSRFVNLIKFAGRIFSRNESEKKGLQTNIQIEQYPPGYPRFSGLIAADNAFNLCRRFTVVRARMLLIKQDRICVLEKQLQKLDEEEQRPLFLGSIRRDRNVDRNRILKELDEALNDYDAFVERNARISQLPVAPERIKRSVLNWIEGTGSISPEEASFLYEADVCTTTRYDDDGLNGVQSLVEGIAIRVSKLFPKMPKSKVSRDNNIFVLNKPAIRTTSRVLVTWLVVALLLVPVIIMRAVYSPVVQILCTMVSSGMFIMILSVAMKASAAEVFVAGATFVQTRRLTNTDMRRYWLSSCLTVEAAGNLLKIPTSALAFTVALELGDITSATKIQNHGRERGFI